MHTVPKVPSFEIVRTWITVLNFYKTTFKMTLRLDITHVGLGMEFKELPFNSSLSLGDLKMKLYPRTGTEAKDQLLTLIYPRP